MCATNSKKYWNERFGTNDWVIKGGKSQTSQHAKQYVPLLNIPNNFSGVICDFGCAQGDAFPIYHSTYPDATLIGVDFSEHAIKQSITQYGHIANFICGSIEEVPTCEIIISSHTFEHLECNYNILNRLLRKCQKCFVIVPYKENPLAKEHLKIYDENSFSDFMPFETVICPVGWDISAMIYRVFIKNFFRAILRRNLKNEPKQIVYSFNGLLSTGSV